MPTPVNLDANAILTAQAATVDERQTGQGLIYVAAGALQQARAVVGALGGPVGATFVVAVAGLLAYRTVSAK